MPRKTKRFLAGFLGAVMVAILLVMLFLLAVPPDFEGRKGKLSSADIIEAGGTADMRKSWLTLISDGGLTVECGLLAPAARRDKRLPAVILMGGKATGKHAVDYALDIRDVIIVAPDYSYDPRPSYTAWEFLWDVPAMRRAFLDMVPAAMLVTDYLFERGDVDTTRIVLLGYSFGAPFVPCIAAHDGRAAVAAIVYGGGNIGSLIRHNVRRYKGEVASALAGALGGILLRPLEPTRYIEEVAPMPLVMINGTEDEQIPRENASMLFARAREPKKQIWLSSRHVNPANTDLTRSIIDTLARELARLNILPAFAGEP